MQLSEELSLCRIYKKSRSLRAFDRRPASEAVVVAQPQVYGAASAAAGETSTHIATNVVNPFQSLETDNNSDTQSCWDYDHFINSFHIWYIIYMKDYLHLIVLLCWLNLLINLQVVNVIIKNINLLLRICT